MSDILEVVVTENPLELVFNDQPLEVLIQEDNLEVSVTQSNTEITINSQDIEILTIAEQGPPGSPGSGSGGGIFPIAYGNTPPSSPSVGDLWLDMN